ncbi:MAG: amylo-alpha-1,6-glucosidase [Rhodoglobus sp.]
MDSLSFDVREIPFSRRGSWLNISPVVALHTTSPDLHLVSHQTGMHAVLALVPVLSGERLDATVSSSPEHLTWSTSEGEATAVFETLDTVRVRGRGIQLRIADAAPELTPFTGTFFFQDPIDGSAIFTSYETGRRYRVSSIEGDLTFEGAEALGQSGRAVVAGGDSWEVVIEEFETARPPYSVDKTFDAAVAGVRAEFEEYLEAVAGWRTEASPAAALAVYVLWSATVSPRGFLARESIFMSKHWMDKVWSWDHCFNALALAPADAGLALDQFLTPFDHQESSGALPDSVTHSEILYNFVKPPIHGWALVKLRGRMLTPIPADQLSEIYAKLGAWSRFWLDARRVPGHALPHYQHGNDSGWDNSTAFDFDRLIESPDLAAFLLIQLDVIADLADELGTDEAAGWRRERDDLTAALMGELWEDSKFHGVGVISARKSKTTSLLTLLPIVAGTRFPAGVADALAADIQEHLTEWGPATQLPGTDEYEDDGYWRGPIWAPSTVIIEDGLRTSGHVELADTVSSRFRRLCETSGFAENFDALTGAGLRDRAYTWTASAYLLLAHEAELRAI